MPPLRLIIVAYNGPFNGFVLICSPHWYLSNASWTPHSWISAGAVLESRYVCITFKRTQHSADDQYQTLAGITTMNIIPRRDLLMSVQSSTNKLAEFIRPTCFLSSVRRGCAAALRPSTGLLLHGEYLVHAAVNRRVIKRNATGWR